MRISRVLISLVLFLVASIGVKAGAAEIPRSTIDAVERLVTTFMAKEGIPGLSSEEVIWT